MKPTLIPYLTFNGNCKEAMKFYESCLGGTLTIQTMAEANTGMPLEEGTENNVMHAGLDAGRLSIMASDTMPGWEYKDGNNMTLTIVGNDEKELRELFEKLSAGGKVSTPLEKQFWGDVYGMLTDKFGINWSVNISSPEQKPWPSE